MLKGKNFLLKRVISCVLVCAMILGLIPQSVYAAPSEGTDTQKTYSSDGFTITYKEASAWDNYVNAEITLANDTDSAKSLWEIQFSYDGEIDSIWNADIKNHDDGTYVLEAKTYNSTIAAGQSVTLGFMAHGSSAKPAMPESITFADASASEDKKDEDTEGGDSEGTDTPEVIIPGQTYEVPEKWSGLNYAVFTSGDSNLSLYTGNTSISGSVHTNQDFYYQGSSIKIDGVLEASKGITIKTAVGSDSIQIGSKLEKADRIEMPDITEELTEYTSANGVCYDASTQFGSDSIIIDTSLYINGDAAFNTTEFMGQGIIYATGAVTYNAGSMSTANGSRLFIASESGDITINGSGISMNAVLYAPNGCVCINSNELNLNGRIIAKQVCINGTKVNINAGPCDLDMLDFIFKPEIDVAADGTKKENRRVSLSVQEIMNTEYIQKENTVWSITRDGEDAGQYYAVDEENSDYFHREMIFREAGTYMVSVTVTTGKVNYTVTKELVIEEDKAPCADFELSDKYFMRDEEGKTYVHIDDSSVSPDGDTIGRRVWTIYYDKDNNGEFDESEGTVISDENEAAVDYTTENVGRYKVSITVYETFDDTIPKLLTEDAYLHDDTSGKAVSECVFEVGNEAPTAALDIEKSKSADIVFTVGEIDADTMAVYTEKADELKTLLAENGIDAKVDAVSTSTYTAQDTFAWKEYGHYNCDGYAEHIIYEEDAIKMIGYYSSPKKDFLYIANDNPGQKTFEFDLQRDNTDWHSMEGGGFLFNTTVSDDDNYIKGFCILVTRSGLKLVRIDCDNLQRFRDGGVEWVQNVGQLLRTYSIPNLYAEHHFKIVVDSSTISVWDGDTLVIDNFVLPENDYGYGFGPITSQAWHDCWQRSYFTFKNITMETMTGSSLSDIVDGYDWRAGASHYVLNISSAEVPELVSDDAMAELAAALIRNQAAFAGIGSDTNESQYLGLLNAANTGGMYVSLDDLSSKMDTINTYILQSVLSKDYSIDKYITTDDIITYKGYYQDAENDEIYEEQWEYEYDPSAFTSSSGEAENIVKKVDEPITVFENTGAYSIRLAVRDNPTGDNDALDGYRLWSDTEQYDRLLLVQTRPAASVSVTVSEDSEDSSECIANAVYEAYDADHTDDSTQGIREEYFCYKNVKDAGWTEGKLPNRLAAGCTYLVKYQVKDAEGTLSFPAVAVVCTTEPGVYEEIDDTVPPTVYIDTAKTEIKVGEELLIDGYALDDYGVDSYEMYIDGELVLSSFGRVILTPDKAGEIKVKAVATDIGGNTSEKEITITVVDDRDTTPPVAEITSPNSGSELGFNIQIKGTADDETKFDSYTLSYRAQSEDEYHVFAEGSEAVTDDVLGTLDVSEFTAGTYDIRLTVKDAAGNVSYYGITLYIEVGTGTSSYALSGSIDSISLSEDKSQIDIKGSVNAEGNLDRYSLTYSLGGYGDKVTISEGTEEVTDGILGSINTSELSGGTYYLTLTATDTNGNSGTASASFGYTVGTSSIENENTGEIGKDSGKEEEGKEEGGGEEQKPETQDKPFSVSLSYSQAAIGTAVKVQVTLPSDIDESTLVIYKGEEEIASGTRKTEFTSAVSGKVRITAVGTDTAGEKRQVTAYCNLFNDKDKKAPVAEITSPAIDEALTEPVDITGSAYDETELDYWKLEYRMTDSDTYILLSEGTEKVKDGTLGRLDTTMLMNGQYTLRLTVCDKGGNRTRLENDYVVEGGLKVGAMNIGFTDITAKMGGSTVTVNRMYDSRNKQQGDFGIGWTLGISGMKLYETNDIANGYQMTQSGSLFSTAYQISETVSHDVTVTYGDGTSDRFEVSLSPERRALVPISEVTVSYKWVTSQKVKLEIIGDTTAYFTGNGLMFYEDSMFDDLKYKLTNKDGVQMYMTADGGVYKIADTDGNVITVDENGYHAENGKSIIFDRDSKERVTAATDPNGNTTKYAYDDAGDLISVTDSADRTVSFTYDAEHNLISITDPMGIAVARNEYDDDGRLIATIDADENRIEYDYDVDGRTEAVKDRRGNTTVYTYDDSGNILQTVDACGGKTTNTYDDMGNLLSTTDANGNTTGYDYDSSGNVTKVTAADGTAVSSEYTQDNLVSGIQMMDKTVMAMEYDDYGRLTSLTDADGNDTEYTYSSDGKLTGVTDGIGTVQTVTYDADGNAASTTNGAGETASYTYDKDGRCTSVTVSRIENGETLTFTSTYNYNEAGDIIQSVDNSGNVTAYEYDADGNMIASTDAKGRRITYEYDDLGNTVKTAYPDGTCETFDYDANDNNTSATDRSGQTVQMEYDKLNRLTKKTYADGTSETYTYDAAGNVTSVTGTGGGKTTYAYDCRGRNTSVTDALGNTTVFAYDEASRLVSQTDALGGVTSYEYDDNGNVTKTTYADGNSVTAKYDARSRITEQKDQNGSKTEYAYDGADRLAGVTDADGGTYTYGYDGNGNLATVTDALGNTTTYTYDAGGRVSTVKNALGGTASYVYDETGNVAKYTDCAGNVTTYVYDDMDRLTEKNVSGEKTSYTYSKAGLLTKVTDGMGTVSFSYDSYGRLTGKTDAAGNKLTYTYDKCGRLSSMDNGFGGTKYEYDIMDRVTRVIDRNGQATVYEYDALGNRSAVCYPNGNVMTYTYDACSRLKEECIVNADGVTLAKYTYGLGKAGERLSVTDITNGIETDIAYEYDSLNRLTKEVIERGDNKLTNEYGYDSAGNRTSKETKVKGDITELADTQLDEVEITEGTTTYTYNALNQLVNEKSDDGTITYTYDANGNLTEQAGRKTASYSYDAENRLTKATVQSGNSVTIESYTYDYAGNRTSKTVNEDSTVYYVTDTSGSLAYVAAEMDADGKETASYTRCDGELMSMERSGEVWYYLYDGLGSTRLLTNEAGRITDKYAYDAYGSLLKKSGGTENDFLYTGEQYNANTGLYYLRARYMNPGTGTFISMDSYQGSLYDPISLHKYLYANANPVTYTDPSGYFSLPELSAGMTMSQVLSSSWKFIGLNTLIGSLTGAAVGAVDSILGGNNFSTVLQDAFKGLWQGALFGCVLSSLTCFATISPICMTLLCASQKLLLVSGTVGVAISAEEGHPAQAIFRAIVSIFAYKSLGKIIDGVDIAKLDGATKGYSQDANGRWHRSNGQFASNSEVGITGKTASGKGVHGNSLTNNFNKNYGYALIDKNTSEVLKFGETLYPDTRYTQSYLDSINAEMKVLVSGQKLDIHLWQHDMNMYYFYKYGDFPPLNKKGW